MYHHMESLIKANFQDVTCLQGDSNYLPGSLNEKLQADIQAADVVIADCSGKNPNVFYEIGVAHALLKPVVLIHEIGNDVISS
jgi:nucleoside 2-deoxyribosyltransferase